ncbi:hypothetical protein A2973_05195 [Candidatus Gottesmanbacteria bacterium RIFCSPLOWO2_01_FULL_49_10]|uniref:Thioredoxin domain-containing protein n=1 Tax=Candidatus Gottesmanbacteria bacterium RIFCSPLOWO2_01_FULL_49_10 TaxID=1798396 RepID=A0A1F6AZD9_9BACT|nr:MAG: hypothetical protein A2973_05195 [Candidatus Gottesmanbacteria bacterium RIFCSPLOWO2_01_FULL_49_10]
MLERGGTTRGTSNGTTVDSSGQPQVAGVAATPPSVPPPIQEAADVPKITQEDHLRGDKNARITLIEYSDIECPYCKSFHPTAKKVVDTYNGKVSWVFRHYPLSFHQNAQKEAEAVECASEQGGNDAFWKILDALYERTTSGGLGFALDKLGPLARELGLDEAKFQACLDSGKYTKRVKDEMAGGTGAGVNGTPGNILLDTKSGKTRLIPGAVPFETIKASIDEMLK